MSNILNELLEELTEAVEGKGDYPTTEQEFRIWAKGWKRTLENARGRTLSIDSVPIADDSYADMDDSDECYEFPGYFDDETVEKKEPEETIGHKARRLREEFEFLKGGQVAMRPGQLLQRKDDARKQWKEIYRLARTRELACGWVDWQDIGHHVKYLQREIPRWSQPDDPLKGRVVNSKRFVKPLKLLLSPDELEEYEKTQGAGYRYALANRGW